MTLLENSSTGLSNNFSNANGYAYKPMTDQQKKTAAFYLKRIDPMLNTILSGKPFMYEGKMISVAPNSSDYRAFKDIQVALDTFQISYDDFMTMYVLFQSFSSGYAPSSTIMAKVQTILNNYGFGANTPTTPNKKGFVSNPSNPPSANNLLNGLLGIGVSLAVIYGVFWVASKAWKKGEA